MKTSKLILCVYLCNIALSAVAFCALRELLRNNDETEALKRSNHVKEDTLNAT